MAFRDQAGNRDEAGIDDPGLFPHRLSFDEGLVSLLPTSQAKLRAATFLDDRSDIATAPARLLAMDDILHGDLVAPAPDRFLFHMSFCGSTLLSRLLDCPGAAMPLREPQCLSDLAARRSMLDQSGEEDPRVDRMLARLPALLARRWREDEPTFVKPSNWVNNLAPALCAGERPVLPVFLTIDPRRFLHAVFRGGGERIAFTARAAVHFSQAGQANAERVARALEGSDDPPAKLARLAALAHRMQAELFDAARAAGGWNADRCLDLDELSAAPVATALRAADLLQIDLPPDQVAANAARWLPQNAKQPDAVFSDEAQRQADRAVADAFGKEIDSALAWAKSL